MHPLREQIRLELADTFLAKNRVTSAVDILEKGLSLQPDSPAINYRLGMIYSQLKEYETAEKYLARVVLTHGEGADLMEVKADAAFALALQAIQIGEVEAFKKFLEETFHWKPDHKVARFFAAGAAFKQGNLNEAAEHLQFLVDSESPVPLSPKDWMHDLPFPEGPILAAALYHRSGQTEFGHRLLRRCMERAKKVNNPSWIGSLEKALDELKD